MPLSPLLTQSATVSTLLFGAGWTVQLYQKRLQKIRDEQQYDLQTKCCPTLEEFVARRAAKGMCLPHF